MLGVSADADDEAIAAAYRKLAKRFHPDARPDDEGAVIKMAEINIAYALLRDSQAEMHARTAPVAAAPPGPPREASAALGRELAAALDPGEEVVVATDAATWDAFRVRLAVTDRRLLWLRADAPTDRVRSLPWNKVASIDGRLKRPRRRIGELLVQPRHGKRLSFSELDPTALQLVVLAAKRQL